MHAPTIADALASAALPHVLAAAEGVEFSTFLVGTRLPRGLARADDGAREDFRRSVRDALIPRLRDAWPERQCVVSCAHLAAVLAPDVPGRVRVAIAPLFVAGRYRKLVRGLSQTVFHCRRCRGASQECVECGGTGRVVAEAVADFAIPPIVCSAGGRGGAFHGSGREDVDVRMLGRGRPFVVSVRSPRRRSIDADTAAREIATSSAGRVEVEDLRVVTRRALADITSVHGEKTYRARIECDEDVSAEDLARITSLAGVDVLQRTPHRVERRRADAIRSRRVHEIVIEETLPRGAVLRLRTDAGTYVKELVSGDESRTTPSFASLLDRPCRCTELDVLDASVVANAESSI